MSEVLDDDAGVFDQENALKALNEITAILGKKTT